MPPSSAPPQPIQGAVPLAISVVIGWVAYIGFHLNIPNEAAQSLTVILLNFPQIIERWERRRDRRFWIKLKREREMVKLVALKTASALPAPQKGQTA